MKLIYVRDSKSRGYLSVCVENDAVRQTLFVPEGVYSECGAPSVGDEIDESVLSRLLFEDEKYRAILSSLKMLSLADNSWKMLCRKLVAKGYSKKAVAEAMREATERGYINEPRQMRALILREANEALSGPRKISSRLYSKGYPLSEGLKILDSLIESGEVDFERSKQALIEKKLARGAGDEEIRKLLYKHGYDIC